MKEVNWPLVVAAMCVRIMIVMVLCVWIFVPMHRPETTVKILTTEVPQAVDQQAGNRDVDLICQTPTYRIHFEDFFCEYIEADNLHVESDLVVFVKSGQPIKVIQVAEVRKIVYFAPGEAWRSK